MHEDIRRMETTRADCRRWPERFVASSAFTCLYSTGGGGGGESGGGDGDGDGAATGATAATGTTFDGLSTWQAQAAPTEPTTCSLDRRRCRNDERACSSRHPRAGRHQLGSDSTRASSIAATSEMQQRTRACSCSIASAINEGELLAVATEMRAQWKRPALVHSAGGVAR